MTETLPGATQTFTIPVEPPAGLAAAPVEAAAEAGVDPPEGLAVLELTLRSDPADPQPASTSAAATATTQARRGFMRPASSRALLK